jgi:hypothetical protein
MKIGLISLNYQMFVVMYYYIHLLPRSKAHREHLNRIWVTRRDNWPRTRSVSRDRTEPLGANEFRERK